jgi:hypothetical protein
MGIRNLAFCLLDVSGQNYNIISWDNYDLINGTDSQTSSRCTCGGPASWINNDNVIKCKKCVKKERLVCLPEEISLSIKSLKPLSKQENWNIDSKSKKEDYINEVKKRYLLPFKKGKINSKINLLTCLDAINSFLDIHIEIFAKAEVIRIENQPVFDNPTMKSVQIILFTLITHRLKKDHKWTGNICFVHASKKTKEDKEIVNSYKGRKDSAEKLVLEKLKDDMWRNFFLSKQKRSDLADSFLMSLRLD